MSNRGIRSVWIDRGLWDLDDDDCHDWLTWLKRHGMPHQNDIPLGQFIECDDVRRQIRVDVFRKDDRGRVVFDGPEAVTDEVVIQLEGPALPLPGGYEVEVLMGEQEVSRGA